MTHCDVVVLGAGASGLVCAAQCAKRGRRVVVVDHADRPGLKVRISGGGRCNVTNRRVQAENYVCANPHFVKSALAQYPSKRFLAFLAAYGVETVEADHGRLFCVPGAAAVVAALLREAEEAGVSWALGEPIREVLATDNEFQVHCRTRSFASRSLVVATGGPAWPRIGATDFGLRLAEQFGLRVFPARPGLVPLRASGDLVGFCRELSGISLPARVVVEGARIPDSIEDALLFTHRGISGPATLDASLYWRPGRHLAIDLLPGRNIGEMLAQAPRREVRNALAAALPARLAELLCRRHGWSGQAGSLPKKQRLDLERTIHAFPFHSSGTEGLDKAEATLGGVDTDEVSSKTMEAKAVPGLFFIGEVLDVTGRLGGYNLQWAWSSGFVAGQRA
ncbi:aminoacetone oxidase family FAD-binding enzyme [Desulfonatronum sp. SC1]|uniref:NAD(P)/FAD-dependent oxidoreductase n=1 Tax=Desulfonatronum sp. SC1 TaxID=2109626 RepID=UPI000D3169CF|nr:aminoacetone oxidase family FAD-binding enzyme [Desulfonatronum sp. SC1]PTN34903.1 aminoacetone oxidase family FAD-binding enzyme [Desulfonatronum sp. SC1]